ncbi:MAG: thioredoxin family protein [Acidimicrobiales bacterium]
MDVRLVYFDDCPNWQVADARLKEALAALDQDAAAVAYEQVTTPEEAERSGFRGSPTILIDGRDPFAQPDAPVGLSCRIYRTDRGVEPSPTVEQLVAVLSSAR